MKRRPLSNPLDSSRLVRDPEAAWGAFDLVIVGGGVYGVSLALEAGSRGLTSCLFEKDDFGGATSWSSLRIIHGGLRYLQHLDIARFFESVGEQARFLTEFPELVKPLSCLMPLYGKGSRRPPVFRMALAVNDFLRRFNTTASLVPLQPGTILDAGAVLRLFPGVPPEGLRGGALWQDAVTISSERLLVEMLREAARLGATALNYTEAVALSVTAGRVAGVVALDRESGREIRAAAPVVVNCAGPWCRAVASRFHRDQPRLFIRSLAFNLLLDCPPPAPVAIAVTPPAGGRTYFVLPWKGRTLAGTCHMLRPGDDDDCRPPAAAVAAMRADLAQAVCDWREKPPAVLRVYSGFLPAKAADDPDMARRPVFHDHGAAGGPLGLYSMSGVKFTTARLVAARILTRIFGPSLVPVSLVPPAGPGRGRRAALADACRCLRKDPARFRRLLAESLKDEAVLHLDDFVLRRQGGIFEPAALATLLACCRESGHWQDGDWAREEKRLRQAIARCGGNGVTEK